MTILRPIEIERQERNKKILKLFYTGQYTLKEISIELGIEVKTVSRVITKSMKK